MLDSTRLTKSYLVLFINSVNLKTLLGVFLITVLNLFQNKLMNFTNKFTKYIRLKFGDKPNQIIQQCVEGGKKETLDFYI